MRDYNAVEAFAQTIGCDYKRDVQMKNYTSFKIGGTCNFLFEPEKAAQIQKIVVHLKQASIPYHIIGNGSNLLVSDAGIDGCVIYMGPKFANVSVLDDGILYCRAGTSLAKVCTFAWEHGLTGMEFAYGIPGSIGGAVYMNAGAYGGEMKDVILCCDHIDHMGQMGTLTNYQCAFSYRHSVYVENGYCITGVSIRLEHGEKDKIRAAMDDVMQRRREKQPLELPSAGSTFKRPEGHYASALVDQCGLRGFRVGDAMVSDKHCGFVVNMGNATAADVLELIERVRFIVLEKTGYQLEREVMYLQ